MPPRALAYVVWKFPKLSETFIVEELNALAANGIMPLIFALERPVEPVANEAAEALAAHATWPAETSRSARLRTMLGLTVRHPFRLLTCLALAVASGSRQSVRNLRWAVLVAMEIEHRRIEYLHAHFADNAGDVAYFAARLTGIPFGITAHAVDIYLGKMLCRKLRAASVRVTVCAYNVDRLVERCPSVDRKAYTIKYAGIDTARFALRRPRPPRCGRTILAVGRLTPKKGFDHLVRAVAVLRSDGVDCACWIVGSGDERPALLALVEELGVSHDIVFLGDRAPSEVIELLEKADVLAAPCTIAPWGDRDSMPVVLKEAMAMELPVVATADFGIPELIYPDAGILVPRDDFLALAGALREILSMPPEERQEMGRAGRRMIEARFRESTGVEVLIGEFRRVLGAI